MAKEIDPVEKMKNLGFSMIECHGRFSGAPIKKSKEDKFRQALRRILKIK